MGTHIDRGGLALLLTAAGLSCARFGFGPSSAELRYPMPTLTLARGQAVFAWEPDVVGLAAPVFAVAPSLPAGVAIDRDTGALDGTPTTLQPPTSYVVTATGQGGAASARLSIEVREGFHVDTTADAGDAAPDGHCDADLGDGVSDTPCTLRAALAEASNATTDRVVLVPAGSYAFLGGQGMTGATVIQCEGRDRTTIDLASAGRFLDVAFAEIVVRGCTVSGGSMAADGGTFVVAEARLTLEDCEVRGGRADRGGAIYGGTGATTVIVRRSRFADNVSVVWGGAIDVTTTGTRLEIYDSVFVGNRSDDGGAVNAAADVSIIERSSFIANQARLGGGLDFGRSAGVVARLVNSTFVDNTATANGGALIARGEANLAYCSFVGNTADTSGDAVVAENGTLRLRGSLIAAAEADDACAVIDTGVLASDGFNVTDADVSGCPPLTATGDRTGVRWSEELAAGDNGGLTPTVALGPADPAVDAAADAACPATDQRSAPRPGGPACDAGAFERHGNDPRAAHLAPPWLGP